VKVNVKLVRWLLFVATVCMSFGWMFWCWHDLTHGGDSGTGYVFYREQTHADHAAAILFAAARVVATSAVGELVWPLFARW
jgi:hypothetical protein